MMSEQHSPAPWTIVGGTEIRSGTRIETTMGCRLIGTVIDRIPDRTRWTDGTYRFPESHERAVPVRWDDGTTGWINAVHVKRELES